MKEYINAVNDLYSPNTKTLSESIKTASEFEIDLILESMDDNTIVELADKLMEFEDPSDQDIGLLTKIGAKIFGKQWASNRQGALQALDDHEKFMSDWGKYSSRFNQAMTVDNLKEFLKNEYQMGEASFELAATKVKPKVERRSKVISNIEDFIPALSYAYFYGVGDQIEQRAEERQIDIDALGYDDIPNNDTDFDSSSARAETKAAPEPEAENTGSNSNSNNDGVLTGQEISSKMNKTLNSLHISNDQRKEAMADSKKGFSQSYSKNAKVLSALGYSYLKAIGAA